MLKIPQHPTFTQLTHPQVPTDNNHAIDGSNADIPNTLTKVGNTAQAVVTTATVSDLASTTLHATTTSNIKQLLEKYNALIEEEQIDRLKSKNETDRTNDVGQIIKLAASWKTNDLDSVMAIYTALLSNNNTPIPSDPKLIYLFRAHPLEQLPDPDNPYADGTIGNQPQASAIIFDLDKKCQRSAGLDNTEQQKTRASDGNIDLSIPPLPNGSINFVVDTSQSIVVSYEGKLKRYVIIDYTEENAAAFKPEVENIINEKNQPRYIRVPTTAHSDNPSINLRVTLADVLNNQGKIYKDIRSKGTQATVSVEMPEGHTLPYIATPSHSREARDKAAWSRLAEIINERWSS